jgi:hypothetical protein
MNRLFSFDNEKKFEIICRNNKSSDINELREIILYLTGYTIPISELIDNEGKLLSLQTICIVNSDKIETMKNKKDLLKKTSFVGLFLSATGMIWYLFSNSPSTQKEQENVKGFFGTIFSDFVDRLAVIKDSVFTGTTPKPENVLFQKYQTEVSKLSELQQQYMKDYIRAVDKTSLIPVNKKTMIDRKLKEINDDNQKQEEYKLYADKVLRESLYKPLPKPEPKKKTATQEASKGKTATPAKTATAPPEQAATPAKTATAPPKQAATTPDPTPAELQPHEFSNTGIYFDYVRAYMDRVFVQNKDQLVNISIFTFVILIAVFIFYITKKYLVKKNGHEKISKFKSEYELLHFEKLNYSESCVSISINVDEQTQIENLMKNNTFLNSLCFIRPSGEKRTSLQEVCMAIKLYGSGIPLKQDSIHHVEQTIPLVVEEKVLSSKKNKKRQPKTQKKTTINVPVEQFVLSSKKIIKKRQPKTKK